MKCPNCGNRRLKERADIKFQFDRSVDYFECKNCGCLFTVKDGEVFSIIRKGE